MGGQGDGGIACDLHVAVINGNGAGDGGTLLESVPVDGTQNDDFDQFTFTDFDDSGIDPTTLAESNTVVLNQVFTSDLSQAQEQTLSNFVTSGGKLIILDADGTEGNDDSWLPVPAGTGTSCENCGNTDGSLRIVENSDLISADPNAASYIDVSELPGNTDAAGDANIITTTDSRWDNAMYVTNDNNVGGSTLAYASDGGELVYNGLDTDSMSQDEPSGTNWLQKLYFQELALPWDLHACPTPSRSSAAAGVRSPIAGGARSSSVPSGSVPTRSPTTDPDWRRAAT